MSSLRPLALLAVLPLAVLPLCGCLAAVGTGAAVATSSFLSNGLSRTFRAQPDLVWNAALQALHDSGHVVPLGLQRASAHDEIVVSAPGALRIQPLDLDPLPTETHLKLEVLRPGYVRVFVRVGMFETADSTNQARTILDGIDRALRHG